MKQNVKDAIALLAEDELGQELPEIRIAPPGPKSRAVTQRMHSVECPAFEARRDARADQSGALQFPIVYARARGANVWDEDGNRYVDLTAGFGALVLGHGHSDISARLAAQDYQLGLALGDVYSAAVKVELMEALARLFPEQGARVLLGLSGADAVTAALKTAVLATGKSGLVAFEGSYHGLSHGPLAVCGLNPRFREPFRDHAPSNVTFIPYPSQTLARAVGALESALSKGTVGAVIVEPILGRGGCVVPPDGFLAALRSLCDHHHALLVVDEIWTGFGRTGAMMLSAASIVPDIVCLGKGLGAGSAISACIGRGRVMAAWARHGGSTIHTSTHVGSPPSCAAALEVLSQMAAQKLDVRAHTVGSQWIHDLRSATIGLGVCEVRGLGLMIGIELNGGSARAMHVVRKLLNYGYILLTGGLDGNVLTLTPPLNISEALLRHATLAIVEALKDTPA